MPIVTGSIFLACEELFRVEELVVGASMNFTNNMDSRSTDTALDICLPAPSSLKKVLRESSSPTVVLSLGIRLDAVFQAGELPGGTANIGH